VDKAIAAGVQPRRDDARAGEHQFMRHLSQRQASDELRHRDARRAVEHLPEGGRELLHRDRSRRHRVDRPGQCLRPDTVEDDVQQVGQRDPAPVLPAAPDRAAEAQFKTGQ